MSLWVRAAVAVLLAVTAQQAGSAVPDPPATLSDGPRPAAAGASGPLIPPATIDDTLEVVGESIAARATNSRLSVEVKVNGSGPFRFLVDSGADRSVIGAALATRLALATGGTVTLQSVAGASRIGTVMVDRLDVGTSQIHGILAPALPEQFLGSQGILGIDALAEQRLMMDFDRKTITLQDPSHRAPIDPGEIVVTARLRHGQLILTQAGIPEGRVLAIIDTGAQITMGNSALLARVFRGRKPPVPQPITLISVTGQEVTANLIVLPLLRIGSLTLENLPIAFADVPPFALFGVAAEPALLLGTDALEAFKRVSLDFRQRKVRFQLRRAS